VWAVRLRKGNQRQLMTHKQLRWSLLRGFEWKSSHSLIENIQNRAWELMKIHHRCITRAYWLRLFRSIKYSRWENYVSNNIGHAYQLWEQLNIDSNIWCTCVDMFQWINKYAVCSYRALLVKPLSWLFLLLVPKSSNWFRLTILTNLRHILHLN